MRACVCLYNYTSSKLPPSARSIGSILGPCLGHLWAITITMTSTVLTAAATTTTTTCQCHSQNHCPAGPTYGMARAEILQGGIGPPDSATPYDFHLAVVFFFSIRNPCGMFSPCEVSSGLLESERPTFCTARAEIWRGAACPPDSGNPVGFSADWSGLFSI